MWPNHTPPSFGSKGSLPLWYSSLYGSYCAVHTFSLPFSLFNSSLVNLQKNTRSNEIYLPRFLASFIQPSKKKTSNGIKLNPIRSDQSRFLTEYLSICFSWIAHAFQTNSNKNLLAPIINMFKFVWQKPLATMPIANCLIVIFASIFCIGWDKLHLNWTHFFLILQKSF